MSQTVSLALLLPIKLLVVPPDSIQRQTFYHNCFKILLSYDLLGTTIVPTEEPCR